MDSPAFVPWLIAALLLFWGVGVYNRLVGLRGVIRRRFVPVDQQLAARSSLLQRLIDACAAEGGSAGPELETLRAARGQADSAWAAARRRPASADTITSLRLALQILAQARERLPARADEPEANALRGELDACDTALRFAQERFNEAVREYNDAVAQFPSRMLAHLFQFRGATPL